MYTIPVWVWPAAAGAALIGVLLVIWGLRGDRAKGRRRCPRCWYDMSGGPSLTCPECGHAAPATRALVRTRRRWWAAAAGLALVLPLGAVAGARYGRQAWYAVLPKWKLIEDHRWGADRARLYRVRDPNQRGARAVITRGGMTVADIDEVMVFLGGSDGRGKHSAGLMTDVTGDGNPDVVVETYSGGAHCCSTTRIISMGPSPRELAVIETQSEGLRFESGDEPGRMVLITADPTFEYWMTAYVSSARPGLVLRFDGEKLGPDGARMSRPAPAAAVLADAKAQVSARSAPGMGPDPVLWVTMLDLMYSGHEAEAWLFFEDAWPASLTGKDEFRRAFESQLAKSPWWPRVRESLITARTAEAHP